MKVDNIRGRRVAVPLCFLTTPLAKGKSYLLYFLQYTVRRRRCWYAFSSSSNVHDWTAM